MDHRILGLRTCIFRTSNLDAAKAWYTDVFQTEPYFDQPFYVGFDIAGYELGLQPEEQPLVGKPENVLTYWGVEDVQAAYDRMLSLGATEHEAPQNVGGEIVVASVRDLWGNVIGLIYNPDFRLP